MSLCKILIYRHHMPPAVVKRFYAAFVRSRLEYCSAVWCGAPKNALLRLEKIQLQIARALMRIRSASAALASAGLPTLSWRRREHCLILLWKTVHSQGPSLLATHLPAAAADRSAHSLRQGHSLQFPWSSTSRRLTSFLCVTIPVWN